MPAKQEIESAISDSRDVDSPVSVNLNLSGELPRILRQNLCKHLKETKDDEEVGRVRPRRVRERAVCACFLRVEHGAR